jgi:hypothetical protein
MLDYFLIAVTVLCCAPALVLTVLNFRAIKAIERAQKAANVKLSPKNLVAVMRTEDYRAIRTN